MNLLLVHSFLLAISGIAHASVTAYGPHVQQPFGTVTAASVSYTGAASYDNVVLTPPLLPNPPPPTSFGVQLQTGVVPSSDGRPVGVVDVQTVSCDKTNNVCNVKVPAPQDAALVFLSDQTLAESDQGPRMTFPTTAWTKLHKTATIDPSALATSNGNKGIADSLAGTSQSGANGAFGLAHALPSVGALVAVGTFVCLESLLSYAVGGNSLLGSVLGRAKNAR